jgi:hypothetical protein
MTILLFIVFTLSLYIFNRGVLIFFKSIFNKTWSIDKLEFYGIPIFIFYPIFSLFIIGNLSVLANFIVPIKELNLIWIIFLIFFALMNLKENFLIENKFLFLFTLIIVPAILSISSYGLKFHFDSVDYHLNFQYWIRENKIVFGLSNLYIAYGWSTIYEYILSNFWFGNNFLALHFINITFFTFFYNFIFYNLTFNKDLFLKLISINIVIYSFLDNFGVKGGANGFVNIQMVGKPDEAAGILFFVSFLLLMRDYLKNQFSIKNFLLVSTLSLFAFQIKIVSSYLVIPLFFYLFKLKIKNFSKIQLSYFLYLLSNLAFFVLKNTAISGCLIFPIHQTCINSLSWTDSKNVQYFSKGVREGNNLAVNFSENIFEWFTIWINHAYNYQIYSNLILSILIIWIINKLLLKNINKNLSRNEIVAYLFILFLVIAFFLTGPTLRYGFGLFLIIISSLTIKEKVPKNLKQFNFLTYVTFILLIFSIILTPRLYSYKLLIENSFEIASIENNIEEYLNTGSLVNSKERNVKGSTCFIPKTCVKNDRIEFLEYSLIKGYKFYSFSNSTTYK